VQREDCIAAASYFGAEPAARPEKLPLVTISNEIKIYQYGHVLSQPERTTP
jgi:hypothetical protein